MKKRKKLERAGKPQPMDLLSSGLVKQRPNEGEEHWGTTREVALILGVTTQRVGQYVLDEGLPKAGRDRFYLPDVVNWKKVHIIAEAMGKRPCELEAFGYVDFTFSGKLFMLDPKDLQRILGSG